MNALLPLSLLLAQGQFGDDRPRVYLTALHSNVGVPLGRPDLYDGLMVATVVGPAVGHPLPGLVSLASQRVRVEDSRAFPKGTVVEVYLETPQGESPRLGVPVNPDGALPVGARLLLVAKAARKGVLRVPDLNSWDAPVRWTLPLGSGAPPSAFGEAFFLTARSGLSSEADPKWRFVESLAQAIPGSGDANAVGIASFMHTFAGPHPDNNYGQAEDRLSLTFAKAVAHDTAYHRALVDFALNDLRYWGYGDRFFHDLQSAAEDPGAFPNGVPPLQFEESPGTGNNPKLPKEFRHDPPLSQGQILALLGRAKSPVLTAAYLAGLTDKPADADVRALARFLDSPDPRLRLALVERLAAWNGEPAPEKPKEVVDPATMRSHQEYPGLDAAVARWKTKLGTP